MTRERQIKEMAECIGQNFNFSIQFSEAMAEILYNNGFRNAEYVAMEISDEIDYFIWQFRSDLAEGVRNHNVKKDQ